MVKPVSRTCVDTLYLHSYVQAKVEQRPAARRKLLEETIDPFIPTQGQKPAYKRSKILISYLFGLHFACQHIFIKNSKYSKEILLKRHLALSIPYKMYCTLKVLKDGLLCSFSKHFQAIDCAHCSSVFEKRYKLEGKF